MSDPPTVAEPYVQFKLCSAVFKASNGVGEGRIRGPPPSFSRRGREFEREQGVGTKKAGRHTTSLESPDVSTLCTTRGHGKLRLSR